MALNIDEKFERKLTSGLENDTRNLASFQQSTFERLKIWGLMGQVLLSKVENV